MLKINMRKEAELPLEEELPEEVPVEEEIPAEEPLPVEDELPIEEEEPLMELKAPTGLLKQANVLYMDSRFGPFECQNCCYFVEPGSCQVVEGDIDPLGVCNVFCPPNHDKQEVPEELPMEEADLPLVEEA